MKKTLIALAAVSSLLATFTWAAKSASEPATSPYAQGKADASASAQQPNGALDANQTPAQ